MTATQTARAASDAQPTARGPQAAAPAQQSPLERQPGLVSSTAMRWLGLLLALGVLCLVFVASLAVGAKGLPISTVWSALLLDDGSEAAFIVQGLRLPRAVLGLLVGAALGTAGALIQALTRNPLADPGILGVNAGAGFAVAIGVGFFGASSITGYLWFAFLGAIMVTVAVYALSSLGSAGASPIRLTLIGVALGALLGGVTSAVIMLDPAAFDTMRNWAAGSLAGRGWDVILAVGPFIAFGLLLAMISARPLNAVSLGDDLARSLGANISRTRVGVVVAVTLLAGAATAAVGPIGFVGLMVPHVVRWFVGPDQRWIMPYTIICAPILLIVSDVIGRVVLAPQELEVGIVTAFVGAPVLIMLVRRAKVSGL